MSTGVREAAVAGRFYAATRAELERSVTELLRAARPTPPPKALVVPHAGYMYSGPVAASAYASVRDGIERVVLVGPSHRVRVDGIAAPGAVAMRTPLGDVAVDVDAIASVGVGDSAAAHAREHSLEVQLPFLQRVAPRAKVIPLVASGAGPEEVGRVLEGLWGGPSTLIVVSSDLSHYLPYEVGRAVDEATVARVAALDPTPLTGDEACGAAGINGLVWVARRKRLRAAVLDRRSSGDTAGPRDEVVGYAAIAFYEGDA
jgi:AmmeMemoRadiSam system protein B